MNIDSVFDSARFVVAPGLWLLMVFAYKKEGRLSTAAWVMAFLSTVGLAMALTVTIVLLLVDVPRDTERAMRVTLGLSLVLLLLPFVAGLLSRLSHPKARWKR